MPSEQPPTRVEKCPTCGSDDPTKVHHGPPKARVDGDRWVNAVVEFVFPLDDVPVTATPEEKSAAAYAAVDETASILIDRHGAVVTTTYEDAPSDEPAQPQPREGMRAHSYPLTPIKGRRGWYRCERCGEEYSEAWPTAMGCAPPCEPAQPQPRGEGDAGKTRGYTREDIQANTWWPGKGGEGDDLAARLEARADNADEMAAEVARNQSNYGESGPRHHARLLAAAYAFRKAAEMARASTHPEQSERIVGAALDLLDSLGAPHYHDLIGTTYTLRKEQADNLRAALEPASPTPTEQGEDA